MSVPWDLKRMYILLLLDRMFYECLLVLLFNGGVQFYGLAKVLCSNCISCGE